MTGRLSFLNVRKLSVMFFIKATGANSGFNREEHYLLWLLILFCSSHLSSANGRSSELCTDHVDGCSHHPVFSLIWLLSSTSRFNKDINLSRQYKGHHHVL